MVDQKNSFDNEINIYDLWKVIVKRKKLIIGLFVTTVTAAVVISLLLPKIYGGNAIILVQPGINITPKEIFDFVGKIDSEKKNKILPQTAQSVTDIKLNILKDSKDKMQIFIEARVPDIIPQVVSEIILYINNIELIKRNLKEERERIQLRSSELTSVINDSKKLLQTYDRLLQEGRLIPVGFNPIELKKRISDIRIEKFLLDQNLERLDGSSVEITSQIEINHKPIKPNKRVIVAISGGLSLVAGIFLSLFLEFVEKVRRDNN